MDLLYDLSLLGFCRDDPARITGMPRVVLEQAARLQSAPDCRATFCATEEPLADTAAFVRRHPAFQRAPFIAPPDAAALGRAQVFHTPHSAVPDSVRRHPKLAVVQTVYDMIPFLLPETFTQEYRDYYADILARLLPGDRVITISESAKADFCAHAGFDSARVHVIPLAADARLFRPCPDPARLAAVRARYAIPEGPYFLSVCTFEPRKNLRHVIRAFVALLENQPEIGNVTLVLAGGRGWLFEPILAEIASAARHRARLVTTGFVDDADLAPLYSGALGFLYLSRYEGFGLPPLEAMQCGTPVVAANTSSLPEVIGGAGILLPPDDQEGLCQAMLDLCGDAALRASLSARSLRQAQRFSWEENVRQTAEVYRLAAGERQGPCGGAEGTVRDSARAALGVPTGIGGLLAAAALANPGTRV